MPKINGKNIDPKVYAKRVTEAKKKVASMDPEVKQRIKDMYPKVTKEAIVKKALAPKKSTPSPAAKKNYVTDKKTGKPLYMDTKNPQEAGVGSVGKMAVKLGAKAIQKVVKAATDSPKVKAEAKALKAAKGPSLASKAKKLEASSGKYERSIAKMKAETNQILGSSKKEAYTKAAKTMDKENAKSIIESKKILARAKAEKNAAIIAKATKKSK